MSEATGKGSLGGVCDTCRGVRLLHEALSSLHELVESLRKKNCAIYDQLAEVLRENELLKLHQTNMTAPYKVKPLLVDRAFDINQEDEVLKLKAVIGKQQLTIQTLNLEIAALKANSEKKVTILKSNEDHNEEQ